MPSLSATGLPPVPDPAQPYHEESALWTPWSRGAIVPPAETAILGVRAHVVAVRPCLITP